jgi:molecular chaperone DnaK (HSP70)
MSDPSTEDVGTAIGIDLGTTFSCVGVLVAGTNRVDIIPNDQVRFAIFAIFEHYSKNLLLLLN